MEETIRTQLLLLATTFAGVSQSTLPTIGRLALNDNTFFHRLKSGDGFTVRTADKLLQWFSDNWPENTEWPEGIERPVKTGVAA